jgi:hypothetical protein
MEQIIQEQQVEENGLATEIKDPKKVLDALERAKSDAKKFRLEKEELEKNYQEVQEQLKSWSNELLKERVEREIEKTNLPNAERLLKYIDLSTISFDEDRQIIGLDSQLESIKNDFPELFDAKIRVGGKADSAANSPVNTAISATEKQARYILGKN